MKMHKLRTPLLFATGLTLIIGLASCCSPQQAYHRSQEGYFPAYEPVDYPENRNVANSYSASTNDYYRSQPIVRDVPAAPSCDSGG